MKSLLCFFVNMEEQNFCCHKFHVILFMFVPTNATVKLDDGKMVHAQVIGFVLCHFPNCPIIYPVGPVYYFLDLPSATILLGDLKFHAGFKNVTSEPLQHCEFVDSQGNGKKRTHRRSPKKYP